MAIEEKSHQLPSTIVAQEFGEVNVRRIGDSVEVVLTILMEPTGKDAEGWRTGVALDASVSMKWAYGKKLEGKIPPEVKEEYDRKGWLTAKIADGLSVKLVKKRALQDAIAKGYLRQSENIIQKLARDFIAYLSANLDARGKTLLAYWACGNGDDYEVIGEVTPEGCENLLIEGPRKVSFGNGTKLVPILRYFQKEFRSAKQAMAIFLTDGLLEDFEQVKQYTIELAQSIATGKCHPIKCVLIGVGDDISREQLEELDDLETGTDVDIWDHKIAHEMRSLVEIFAKVVDEHQIVAPTGTIVDAHGNIIKKFPDGVPAKITFQMAADSDCFEFIIGDYSIRQTIQFSQ